MSESSKPSLSDRYWRLPWIVRIGLVLVVAVVGLVVFANVRQVGDGRAPTSRAAAPTTAAAPALAGQIGPGVWLVGSDVQPGTYRSTGPDEVDGWCFWSRHDTASGGPLDGIIASDGTRGGQMVVTVEATDVLFRTDGCAPFERV